MTLRWVMYGLQVTIVFLQRAYPEKLNVIAIPLWIMLGYCALKMNPKENYPTKVFLFK